MYNARNSFLTQLPPVTRNILLINILLGIATWISPDFMIGTFALFPAGSPFFRWWQPLTHMFMHANFAHLFFNMYTLLMFGTWVERQLGTKKYLIFYFACGAGALLLHGAVQELLQQADPRVPTLGASGAIYGVLVGYALLFPRSRMTLLFPPVTMDAKWMVLLFVGLELVVGTVSGVTGQGSNIAHFAHLGGALVGWLLMRYWFRTNPWTRPR